MKYYSGNLGRALIHLFPEIGLDYSKFRGMFFQSLNPTQKLTPSFSSSLFLCSESEEVVARGSTQEITREGGLSPIL